MYELLQTPTQWSPFAIVRLVWALELLATNTLMAIIKRIISVKSFLREYHLHH